MIRHLLVPKHPTPQTVAPAHMVPNLPHLRPRRIRPSLRVILVALKRPKVSTVLQTKKGPAQNVPKPKKPEDIGIETPEALFHFIQYWNDLRNYAIQTGDVQPYADYTSEGYKEEEEIANYVYRLYQKGGWAVGGTRKLTFDPSTLISPSDHVYLIIGKYYR